MSSNNANGTAVQTPKSLRPKSLLRRAVFGLVVLVGGIMVSAWLMHASISPAPEARAAATAKGKTEPMTTGSGAGRFSVVRPF